ncbi:uncharacterized protein LOC124124713 isoform X1 [Haliotis rufescens]|uniref:uncharacterized protein LOC124124713 isoform X1 n=1 Tax=Haliotis rufescens TaxID=6454 RepID=UPI00201ECAB6|nr:uncharacterized protein LOC124124713 isoform X1 [Haliotis rufescens]XP_048239845.1 uncharacterized protein LOC124124713 isoform X1 [Haliotis rufescens]
MSYMQEGGSVKSNESLVQETEGSLLKLENILKLKQQKANVKSTFTKNKNKLYSLLESSDQPSRIDIRDGIDKVNESLVKAIDVMTQLTLAFAKNQQGENVAKTEGEISHLEDETNAVVEQAQFHLDNRSDVTSVSSKGSNRLYSPEQQAAGSEPCIQKDIGHDVHSIPHEHTRAYKESHSYAIGTDLWKQLKRVSIPVFSGDVKCYESWKAAFLTCIDQAPATAEYKLLQLRQYLSGEALKTVQALGHSAIAYDIALERLERKYGGRRRQVALQLEEVTNLKPIRQGNARDVQRFADVLDIAVVSLKEADRIEELGNGLLYVTLQKKMTESMVAQYQRWLHDRDRQESVETLREWVLQEAEYQTIAAETIHGVSDKSKRLEFKRKESCSFVSQLNRNSKREVICKVCGEQHVLWKCNVFKNMNVSERWNTAKKMKVCFRCLGGNHRGSQCRYAYRCGINGCTKTHNRLLHENIPRTDIVQGNLDFAENSFVVDKEDTQVGSPTKGHDQGFSERAHATMPLEFDHPFTALRTVPVVLKNGTKRIRVNALLDDASTRSYINADVASELGMQGSIEKISVSVLNGKKETFETKPVVFGIESGDGRVDMEMTALTTTRVTGDLQMIDWQKCRHRWSHLKNISFPHIGRRPIIDLLIGIDHVQLHQSFEEVCGDVGDPIARRTPLGWTCIGNVSSQATSQTHCAYTYHTYSKDSELCSLVKSFWEIEELKTPFKRLIPDDEQALHKAQETLVYMNGQYQIGIPWKNVPSLPNDYAMAFRRLLSTEKKLSKDQETALAYDNIILQYLEKGYINKVDHEESREDVWYLPHFPILRPDKTTTKVRIVFDASAKYQDTSLNDVISPGPKLHSELFDVLIRFRRKPVALICDIAEMFLQMKISPEDRPYHRFLWRSMNTDMPPEVYKFSRLVFGNTSSPFLAQYVTQEHAKAHLVDLPMAAETVIKSTYMDDSMDSVENVDEGIELYNQLTRLWSSASMHARKWLSNSLNVLDNIPEEDRASEIDLCKGHLPSVKALGLMWVAEKDMFTFKVGTFPEEETTKRGFLRQIGRLFDPLGFIGPFIITAKIMLQEMWLTGHDWDDELPQNLQQKIEKWLVQWKEVQGVQVPRCLRLDAEVCSVSIHTFVDASQDAYGTVVYAVYTYMDGKKSSRIVAAKSRVAPLKACSIPRLELMAAVLASDLSLKWSKSFRLRLKRLPSGQIVGMSCVG